MALRLQLRRGTTLEHSSFTGAVGEVTVDTSRDTLVVHDGSTIGGHPVTFDTVTQAEAEGGTSTTRRTWTSQRVRQAALAAFNTIPNPVQTWYDVTSSRSLNLTFTNSTGKPIVISVSGYTGTLEIPWLACKINGSVVAASDYNVVLTIPDGAQYQVSADYGALLMWWELR